MKNKEEAIDAFLKYKNFLKYRKTEPIPEPEPDYPFFEPLVGGASTTSSYPFLESVKTPPRKIPLKVSSPIIPPSPEIPEIIKNKKYSIKKETPSQAPVQIPVPITPIIEQASVEIPIRKLGSPKRIIKKTPEYLPHPFREGEYLPVERLPTNTPMNISETPMIFKDQTATTAAKIGGNTLSPILEEHEDDEYPILNIGVLGSNKKIPYPIQLEENTPLNPNVEAKRGGGQLQREYTPIIFTPPTTPLNPNVEAKRGGGQMQREYTPINFTPAKEETPSRLEGFFTPDDPSFYPFVNHIEVETPQAEARMIRVKKKKPIKAEVVLQTGNVSPIKSKRPSKTKRESTGETPLRESKTKPVDSIMDFI